MIVREYRDTDIGQIAQLYYETIRNVNAKDYSPEQIRVWAPDVFGDIFWKDRWTGCDVFLVENDRKVLGFTEFRPSGEVDCFYVHHTSQRKGVGTLLMRRIEEEAGRRRIRMLYADVSVTARLFFLSKGFEAVREQYREYNGQLFKQYYMEKSL